MYNLATVELLSSLQKILLDFFKNFPQIIVINRENNFKLTRFHFESVITRTHNGKTSSGLKHSPEKQRI